MGTFIMEEWYAPQFEHGDQANCLHCGEVIFFVESVEEDRRRDPKKKRGYWSLTKRPTFDTYWTDAANDSDHTHNPKQFCRVIPGREYSGHCGKHVKYEDQVSEIYACGHHRGKEEQLIKEREREAKRNAEDARRQEILLFEISEYEAAAKWMRDNGFEHLITDYRANVGYANRPRISRAVDVDVFVLMNFIKMMLGGEDDEVHGSQVDTWTIDGSQVQVHASKSGDPFED